MLFYVVELCRLLFPDVIQHKNTPKIKLKHNVGQFELYNPNCLKLWTVALQQRFVVFLLCFLVG